MRKLAVVGLTVLLLTGVFALAKERKPPAPTASLSFIVVKDDNGKPVRNAAVVMHPLAETGSQEKGGMELKTDPEGKASFDGVPYGGLRIQVLAHGFQTYGADYDINQPTVEITIKLLRPVGQYSIYEDHPAEEKPATQPSAPPQK